MEQKELRVAAETWDEYLKKDLPHDIENLRSFERRGKARFEEGLFQSWYGIQPTLPLEAKDAEKEKQFADSIVKAAKDVREKVANESYLSFLKDTLRNRSYNIRRVVICPVLSFFGGLVGYVLGETAGHLLGNAPAGSYGGIVIGIGCAVSLWEYALSGRVYKNKKRLLRELNRLDDNISIRYKQGDIIVHPLKQ